MARKTEKSKQKYKEILEVGMKILRPNRQGLIFCYRFLHHITNSKENVVR